jgi:hypothetical protein
VEKAMATPNDQDLALHGMNAKQGGKILLLACGALAREILDILTINNWLHIDLQCLPAIFHNHPEKITPAIEAAIGKYKQGYEKIFVVYADCGTGGALQRLCAAQGVEMLEGPHCYSFFEGNHQFAQRDEFTAFYLTDFLVRQFDAFIWKPLGLEQHPELLTAYFGNYTTLVYQAQTDDAQLTKLAQAHAQRMGLAFERRFTGYGDLQTGLQAQA